MDWCFFFFYRFMYINHNWEVYDYFEKWKHLLKSLLITKALISKYSVKKTIKLVKFEGFLPAIYCYQIDLWTAVYSEINLNIFFKQNVYLSKLKMLWIFIKTITTKKLLDEVFRLSLCFCFVFSYFFILTFFFFEDNFSGTR